MELLPAKEVLTPINYKSCAIVGSSDNLLRQFLGDEINDHDVVIRFNGATTKVIRLLHLNCRKINCIFSV